MNSVSSAIEYLDKRLATIDKAPGTWGSPESLELQVLLLLELRTFLLRPVAYRKNPFEVRSAFVRFIRQQVKGATAEPLFVQLQRSGRVNELPQLLGEFRNHIVSDFVAEVAPPNRNAPVQVGDLPLEPKAKSSATQESRRQPWRLAATNFARMVPAPPRNSGISAGGTR